MNFTFKYGLSLFSFRYLLKTLSYLIFNKKLRMVCKSISFTKYESVVF